MSTLSVTTDMAEKRAPVPARIILRSPVHLLAFGFGTGLSPWAPGTLGTLVGIPVVMGLLQLPWPWALALIALGTAWGTYLCGESARRLGVHDHGGIVFDEIIGYCVTCIPLLPGIAVLWGGNVLPAWCGLLLAFVLFRFFDIVKPWPISWLDARVHGGLGIMVDDVLAAVFAAVALMAATRGLAALL
jgi:phosphatidylglycerophosphatase A